MTSIYESHEIIVDEECLKLKTTRDVFCGGQLGYLSNNIYGDEGWIVIRGINSK